MVKINSFLSVKSLYRYLLIFGCSFSILVIIKFSFIPAKVDKLWKYSFSLSSINLLIANNSIANTNVTSMSNIDNISKKLKIAGFVLIHPKHYLSANIIHNAWGNKFSKIYYISLNQSNSALPVIDYPYEESRNALWNKTKIAFRYLYDNFGHSYDWFMKLDEDTFLSYENLVSFLLKYNPSKDYYFGRVFSLNNITYCSGGAGYILSRSALKKFITNLGNLCPENELNIVEDLEVGRCLNKLDIYPTDSRDNKGRFRLNPFSARYHILTPAGAQPEWYYIYNKYKDLEGDSCCASDLITFHYMTEEEIMEIIHNLKLEPKNVFKPLLYH